MSDIKIRWIGQSGYLVSDGKTTICIDPYLSDAVNRAAGRRRMVEAPVSPEALVCDAVICTHDHLDHVDVDAIPLMQKAGVTFLAPMHARKTLLDCGVVHYARFDEGDEHRVGDFRLAAVFADHTVPAVGVLLRNGGYTLYFSGDTEYNDRLCALRHEAIDLMFICINGRLGNMNADDAARLTRAISPGVGIPNHYGMFESNTEDPRRYTAQIRNGFIAAYNTEYSVKEILENVRSFG